MLLRFGPPGSLETLGDDSWNRGQWRYTLLRNAAGVGYGLQGSADYGQIGFRVAGQADADAKAAAVAAALAVQGGELVLYRNDNAPSFKSVRSADTLSGVRCVRGPVWSDRPGAQHATWLEFAAAFEWEVAFAGGPSLLEYEEATSVQGGTPLTVVQEYLNAEPEEFVTVFRQKYRVTQQGYAVGRATYPTVGVGVGVPLFPNPNTNPTGSTSPGRAGDGSKGFRVDWAYSWEFASLPGPVAPAPWVG